jgi:hypothetical protein
VLARGDEKLQMIQASAELAETLRWMGGVADQTEFEPAGRLDERELSQLAVRIGIAMFLGVEKLAISGCAAGKVSDGQCDD